ncbi:LLM class flavin-dependent oxidoreductase [Microbacterium sp. SSM24]|uniref:LLM class flavin-dependent oxidoreductase n=1 Tax=Microbacterium sp. SSM24 TaxID=2991714 RepID=UPI002228087A|nr:LLM class flavin-dependent oxidoreductase [Microbacterium sp. SSM24]MCW3491882.1 LLM class flavin-dependent oxidoreductase [Microbacterium sp. SSM24]
MTAGLSIGVAAAIGADLAERLAPAVEAAGFHALWVNDVPGHDALEVLVGAARTTERLVLATGVLPVDRRAPGEILARVDALGLPPDRLVLGIGSGAGSAGALARVTDAAAALRAATSARVVVGALGPKMRHAGAAASDGLLLSWLPPELAAAQAQEARAVAPGTHVALYVRTAVDAAGSQRLAVETARYAGYPAYAANFARAGIAAAETTIGPDDDADRIAGYLRAVDEVVLRAIVAEETPESYERFVAATAPRAANGG